MSLSHTMLHQLNVASIALHDSQHAYETCAKETNDLEFQEWLRHLAYERGSMALDMEYLVETFGQELVRHGSFPGVIQQLWISVKSMLVEANREALLPNIKHSEAVLMKTYHQILEEADLPIPVMSLLNHQLGNIRSELLALENNTYSLSHTTTSMIH